MNAVGFHDLLRKAQGGDQDATDRLLLLLRPYLERTARTCFKSDDAGASVSDLVQESWLRAWARIGQFAGGTNDAETLAMFRAWSGRIVRSVCLQARRDRRRKKRWAPGGRPVRLRAAASAAPSRSSGGVDPAASGSSPSAGARRKEEAAAVRAALARLSDAEEREVVRLRFFESLSFREVAARLGLTYDQVRERFHVGMQRLEKEMRR